jgi:hypothetical protein
MNRAKAVVALFGVTSTAYLLWGLSLLGDGVAVPEALLVLVGLLAVALSVRQFLRGEFTDWRLLGADGAFWFLMLAFVLVVLGIAVQVV